MSDVVENEAMQAYLKPASRVDEPKASSKGFVVRDAPWTSGTEKVRDVLGSQFSWPIWCMVLWGKELFCQ